MDDDINRLPDEETSGDMEDVSADELADKEDEDELDSDEE